MVVRSFLSVLLLAGVGLAQAASQSPKSMPSAPPAQKAAPATPLPPHPQMPGGAAEAELPESTVAVTLNGLCDKPAAGGECKTEITKKQVDEIAAAVAPDSPPAARQRLAVVLAQVLVMSHAAEKAGVQERPDVQAAMRFTRMNVLAQMYVRELQNQSKEVPASEIESYYKAHMGEFEEAKISRLYIPKTNPADSKPIDAKTAKDEADKLKAQASAAGADMKKIQEQAYTDLGLKGTPPNTDMGMVRRENMPPDQAKVFDLKPGEVSDLIDLPGGYFLFKLESKSTQSLDSAKPEIERNLQGMKMHEKIDAISNSVHATFNPEFFKGGPVPTELFPTPAQRGERPGGASER